MAELNIPWILLPLFFIVAVVYSSVGQGGATSYLALFALVGVGRSEIAPVALVLNILVASIGFINYYRAKHFSYQLLIPFLIGSVPAAFLGGLIKLSPMGFSITLGGVLLLAGFRLLFIKNDAEDKNKPNSRKIFYYGIPVGFLIGVVSGITGIGGGVFLTPVLLLTGWADIKQAAATSTAFIVLNSISGLLAKTFAHPIHWDLILIFGAVTFVGAVIGSRLGAYKFDSTLLQKLLAVVLLLAGLKIFWDVVV